MHLEDNEPLDLESEEQTLEAQNKKIEDEAKESQRFRWLMDNSQGREFVWGLLGDAGIYNLSFDTEPLTMAFLEGQRNTGLKLLAKVQKFCPAGFLKMIEENHK